MRGSQKPIRFCAEILFPALILLCLKANASDPPPAMLAAEGLVRLDAVVTDASGNPVPGLAPGDFKLLDNGEPVPILSFSAFNGATAKPDAPVELILVFDDRGAFAPQATATAQEIGDSFKRMQAPLSLPVSIVRVSKVEVIETPQPSTDGSRLASVLEHPRYSDFIDISQRGFGSGLAIGLTLQSNLPTPADSTAPEPHSTKDPPQDLNALGAIAIRARRAPGRKVLIWIGPESKGGLQGSPVADWITEFSTRLREAHIAVYCTCKGDPFMPVPAEPPPPSLKNVHSGDRSLGRALTLRTIAEASGGGVLKSSNVVLELAQKMKDANDFYSLTFALPHADGIDEYHELKLETNEPNLRVHTSTGYFNEPVYYDQPPSLRKVAVSQLEEILSSSKQMSDRECARQIAGLELTERMSDGRRRSWLARMPGGKSRSALEAIAALSVLLDPPQDEVVSLAAPDGSAQREMLAHTSDYLNQTIRRLPDFFAMRTTVLYHQAPVHSDQTWKTAAADQSLQVAENTKTSIVLRHGRELVEKEASRKVQTLRSEGAFGPILSIALLAVESAGNNMKWLRWEQGAHGPLAVFSYSLAEENAHFETEFCCLADSDRSLPFSRTPPVHGELAIDPASGAILRMTVIADLGFRLPLNQSALAVEYSRLAIGGSTYICPERSIAFSRQRSIRVINEWDETFKIYGPFETILNDMTFAKYHLFHSNVKILPGFTPAAAQ